MPGGPPHTRPQPATQAKPRPQRARERGKSKRDGPQGPSLSYSLGRLDQPATAEPTDENLLEALRPRKVTATMQTTAMRATSRAYSTREAPRSVLQRDCRKALTNSYD